MKNKKTKKKSIKSKKILPPTPKPAPQNVFIHEGSQEIEHKPSNSGRLADDYYDRQRSDNSRFGGSMGDTY